MARGCLRRPSEPEKSRRAVAAAVRRREERKKPMWAIPSAVVLLFMSCGLIFAQPDGPAVPTTAAGSAAAITLEVPAGTPLPVVLDQELRIKKAGQPIRGKI